MNTKDYFSQIYPNGVYKNNDYLTKLNFFYPCSPSSVKRPVDPVLVNYNPPLLGDSWIPAWFFKGTFAINEYKPSKWWEYKNINGFQDNSYIELVHVKDDNDLYDVYGYWTYYAKGCGVFYNIGKTLKAYNKLNALYKLGLSVDDIVSIIRDKRYMFNNHVRTAVFGQGGNDYSIKDTAKRLFPGLSDNDALKRLVSIAMFPPNLCTLKMYDLLVLYNIDRINNSADWDDIICKKAKQQQYDSIQFIVQANGNGGWAHEIVFCGMTELIKRNEKIWSGWKYLNNRMLIMNPEDGSGKELCKFDPKKKDYSLVTCDKQSLDSCLVFSYTTNKNRQLSLNKSKKRDKTNPIFFGIL